MKIESKEEARDVLVASFIYVLQKNGLLISRRAAEWAKTVMPDNIPEREDRMVAEHMNEASVELFGELLVPVNNPGEERRDN
jgi:hypothetical protein